MSKISKWTPPSQFPPVGWGWLWPFMQSSRRAKRSGPIVYLGTAIGPSPAAITRLVGSTALIAA